MYHKKSFFKNYHQQSANLDEPDQNVQIIFLESYNYHQFGNSYLEYDITICKADNTYINHEAIMMVNIAFAYIYHETRLSATGGSDLEYMEFVGQISTIMTLKSSKDLISCVDKINENDIGNTSLEQELITNHEPANRGKMIKRQIPLEYLFGFCKTFKKSTKNLGFIITFKTADIQDIIDSILGDAFIITINTL